MLGFQAKTGMFGVYRTRLAGNTGQHIARIKLNAGLGGKHFHGSAAARFKNFGARAEFSRVSVNGKTVVVPLFPVPQKRLAVPEIERAVADGNQSA